MPSAQYNLSRFLEAQESTYETAFKEIVKGRKLTHWMWFIFPQIKGLGASETSKFYAVENLEEATQFLSHPVLGPRLLAICKQLLLLEQSDAYKVFGSPDDVKLKSSMTLFAAVNNSDRVFNLVLDKFFGGVGDKATLEKIEK